MEQARKQHLSLLGGGARRPPSTPQEMDSPQHDLLVVLGRLFACLLILAVVFFGTVAVLSLRAPDTTVQVQR